MNNEIFEKYKDHYQKMHYSGNFQGGSFKFEYVDTLKLLVEKTKSKTILDFGCGKAMHYKKPEPINKMFGIENENVSFYDIGVKEYEVLPEGVFDGVISTDVLEHVPEEIIDETLETIFSKAKKFVFLVISCGLAKKKLPNGENAHVLVKSPEWWNNRCKKFYDTKRIVHIRYTIPTDPEFDILGLTKK
jgi:hypothetical protein